MGWKQFIRQAEAASRRYARESRAEARRSERDVMRRHRELVVQRREHAKASALMEKEAARQQASDEVEEYDNYIAMLTSVHGDCGDRWDWRAVATMAPP